ncbi:phosphotransferase family protein [Saccharopolyspora elongata]|uniref:Phosphotransferase family protein n=2 Tax=Saccharopolyspora elongata TaxID=2530387 RepID=A0A4R4XUD8_9PSEU|nr:phosphotransferase family protein [Saccharopolyspora elongata]
MDEAGLGTGPVTNVRPVGGGTQNLMYRFDRDRTGYVLRRGPRHLRPRTNDALRREMTVLQALRTTDVPHLRLVAACDDPQVLGDSVFYLMEPVDGVNALVDLAPAHLASSSLRHAMGLKIVDALLTLDAVDLGAVGLDGLGHSDGFLERQVGRWRDELAGYQQLGYRGNEIPGVNEVAEWLERYRPPASPPGLMHGDFHLGNVMFHRESADIVAIVDWEMCTVGDPLLDLGWLLAVWADPGETGDLMDSRLAEAGGVATPDELVARYAASGARSLEHLTWYRALACFKLGIVLEGTYARSLAGKATAALGSWMHTRTLKLFERANRLIEQA